MENTDHMSAAVRLRARDKIVYISPSTQVFTILSKQPCLQKQQHSEKGLQRKLQAVRQLTPVSHAKGLGSLLMARGSVPNRLFIGHSTGHTSKCCHRGGLETFDRDIDVFLLFCILKFPIKLMNLENPLLLSPAVKRAFLFGARWMLCAEVTVSAAPALAGGTAFSPQGSDVKIIIVILIIKRVYLC